MKRIRSVQRTEQLLSVQEKRIKRALPEDLNSISKNIFTTKTSRRANNRFSKLILPESNLSKILLTTSQGNRSTIKF